MRSNLRAVLFDLDGTLFDTAQDIGAAINYVLQTQNCPQKPVHELRARAGLGILRLLQYGFSDDTLTKEETRFHLYADIFTEHYLANIAKNTVLFPGIAEVLGQLDNHQLPWGIVTNKRTITATALLTRLEFTDRPACLVTSDMLTHAKPHPMPILHACKLLGVAPHESIYIGDSKIDIEAGRNAGMPTIAVRYGYRLQDDHPEAWDADFIVDSPAEILKIL